MITLRPFQASDAELLVKCLNNSKVTQYITASIPSPYTQVDALWWVEHANETELIKAIVHNDTLIGCISAVAGKFEYSQSAELGYWIDEQYWNNGFATQAVNQFSSQLFETTNFKRLFVSVVTENKASIRVLEKNGFVCEGTLKHASYKNDQFYDEHLYAKIRD